MPMHFFVRRVEIVLHCAQRIYQNYLLQQKQQQQKQHLVHQVNHSRVPRNDIVMADWQRYPRMVSPVSLAVPQ
jgi:hypothetical protein